MGAIIHIAEYLRIFLLLLLQVVTDTDSLSPPSRPHRERLDLLDPLAQVEPRDPEESLVSMDPSAPLALQ